MSDSTCVSQLFELTWNMTKLKGAKINVYGYDLASPKKLSFVNNDILFYNGYIFIYKGQQQQKEAMPLFLRYLGVLLYMFCSNLQRLRFHSV